MARALSAVGALLAVAFGALALVVFATREEDRVAVDDLLALELTRSIGEGGGGEVDLRRLARGDWDRVLVVAPGTSREAVSRALGSEFKGDLPFGSTGQLFVFAAGDELVRFADYRGRATFEGFETPVDELAREEAVLRVDEGVVEPGEEGEARLSPDMDVRHGGQNAVRMTGGATYSVFERAAAPSSSRAPSPSSAARACAGPGRAAASSRRGRARAAPCARRA
jgi:hypothetical protein